MHFALEIINIFFKSMFLLLLLTNLMHKNQIVLVLCLVIMASRIYN